MKWFMAKMVFRIICGNGDHTPQFDEQLRLIAAENADEAYEKAVMIGSGEEDAFLNVKQQMVQWQFIDVSELYCLHELIDGAELYSKINEVDDADAYTNFVHEKAAAIQTKSSYQLLNLI